MNLLITDNEEEDTNDYDLDEDREPLSPISPHKTGGEELPVPATVNSGTVTYNMTFDAANNRWVRSNDWVVQYINGYMND